MFSFMTMEDKKMKDFILGVLKVIQILKYATHCETPNEITQVPIPLMKQQ